jgi:hypothetical protein
VWWCKPVIPALERLRQKDHELGGQPGLYSKTLPERNNKKSKPSNDFHHAWNIV